MVTYIGVLSEYHSAIIRASSGVPRINRYGTNHNFACVPQYVRDVRSFNVMPNVTPERGNNNYIKTWKFRTSEIMS